MDVVVLPAIGIYRCRLAGTVAEIHPGCKVVFHGGKESVNKGQAAELCQRHSQFELSAISLWEHDPNVPFINVHGCLIDCLESWCATNELGKL